MGDVRKGIVLILVLAVACLAVSTQSTLNVWGYKAVRGFYLMPYTDTVGVKVVGTDLDRAEILLTKGLAEEALHILEAELDFRLKRTIRVIIDDNLHTQGMSGYYQMGIVGIAPPSPSSLESMRYGPLLHEMTHLAVDYLAHGNYPAWLTEGIAVYLEVRYMGSTWVDMEQERAWSGIEVLDQVLNSWAGDEQAAAYWQSYVLVSYLYERGGRESILILF